ncbi:hypothetical protein AAF712_010572 [Marasmius tenuissimus]|uniref:Aminotransferase class I/classII large domain-containing protein n=1 Tax=Marasmius tenuissimus TaxID=585030 RepID=A0ABR2ZMF3_9AGAR
MHGDFVPLKKISSTMKQILPPGVGQLYVDETHSVGVIGERGEGLIHMLGMEDDVQLRVQGFGKAMGTSGGVLLCTPTVRHYLLHACRNQVFSTACTQSNIIAMDNTIDMLESPLGREQIRKVHQVSAYARQSIVQIVQNVPPQILRLEVDGPHLCTEGFYSPMVPLVTPLAVSLAGYLTASGYTFREMTQPIVPKGHERIRWTFHAANTTEEVDRFLSTLAVWIKKQISEVQPEAPQDARKQPLKGRRGINARL